MKPSGSALGLCLLALVVAGCGGGGDDGEGPPGERFRDPEFDRLHQRAIGESDVEARGALYRRMQDIMEESGAYRFITHEARPVAYHSRIAPGLRPDGVALLRHFGKST